MHWTIVDRRLAQDSPKPRSRPKSICLKKCEPTVNRSFQRQLSAMREMRSESWTNSFEHSAASRVVDDRDT